MFPQLARTLPPLFPVLACALLAASCGGSSTGSATPAHDPLQEQRAHEHGGATSDGHHEGHGQHHEQGHGMHGNHRFEKADEWVARFEGPERDAWQKPALVVESMAIAKGMAVADIGAGTGYFLPQLAAAVGPQGQAIGLDLEPDMVRYMTERIEREGLQGASAQVCEAGDPLLAPASVDRILIVDTWHHIAEREAYSAKLRAALRPGGQLYIVDFTKESPHGPSPEHRLSAEAVIAELAAGGLRGERIAVDLPYQWVVRATATP